MAVLIYVWFTWNYFSETKLKHGINPAIITILAPKGIIPYLFIKLIQLHVSARELNLHFTFRLNEKCNDPLPYNQLYNDDEEDDDLSRATRGKAEALYYTKTCSESS